METTATQQIDFVQRIPCCFFVSLDSKFGFVLVAFAWEDWLGSWFINKANVNLWEAIKENTKIEMCSP